MSVQSELFWTLKIQNGQLLAFILFLNGEFEFGI